MEFHTYDFEALDRRLTRKERDELRAISTRARITARTFSNFYHWGGLKADPVDLVRLYFDTFAYEFNQDIRWVMMRVPASKVPLDLALQYMPSRSEEPEFGPEFWSWVEESGENLILSLSVDFEGEHQFSLLDPDGEPMQPMEALADARENLMNGDLAFLYLAWQVAKRPTKMRPEMTAPAGWDTIGPDHPVGYLKMYFAPLG